MKFYYVRKADFLYIGHLTFLFFIRKLCIDIYFEQLRLNAQKHSEEIYVFLEISPA